jgi:hypothetical protein
MEEHRILIWVVEDSAVQVIISGTSVLLADGCVD